MIDPKEMTDDEFVDFINASKDRIEMLMGRGDDIRLKFKDDAKKTKAKIKDDTEKTKAKIKDDTEKIRAEIGAATKAVDDSVRKVAIAFFSPEVQKHVIGAGIEVMLGFNAILKAIPVPEKAQPVVDKVSEIRHNAKTVYCKKNPDCPRKNAAEHKEVQKIELD